MGTDGATPSGGGSANSGQEKEVPAATPVGSGEYTVQSGDCFASIAFARGHFWEKLWKHADNKDVKDARKDPNTLLPGDKIHVPPLEMKEESGATEQRHRFRRKGVPSKLALVFQLLGEPRKDTKYRLQIDGKLFEGTTDANGRLEITIPPGAKQGKIVLGEKKEETEYELDLGGLNPLATVSGQKQRLNNLGFPAGDEGNEERTDEYRDAVREFQRAQELTVNGLMTQATLDKLEELCDS